MPTATSWLAHTRSMAPRSVTATSAWQLLCGHGDDDGCSCALAPSARTTAQSLQEMEFSRSACAAAQQGNLERLRKLLKANPEALHSDGTGGAPAPDPHASSWPWSSALGTALSAGSGAGLQRD